MKKVTLTYTIECTSVDETAPDDFVEFCAQNQSILNAEKIAKQRLGVDDLHIHDFKVFVQDIEETE